TNSARILDRSIGRPPGSIESLHIAVALPQKFMEGTALATQPQLLGIPTCPRIDLVIRLPEEDTPTLRRQVRAGCLDHRLHVGRSELLEGGVQTVDSGNIVRHAVIAPFTVNVGTRTQDDPEVLLRQQVEET